MTIFLTVWCIVGFLMFVFNMPKTESRLEDFLILVFDIILGPVILMFYLIGCVRR